MSNNHHPVSIKMIYGNWANSHHPYSRGVSKMIDDGSVPITSDSTK